MVENKIPDQINQMAKPRLPEGELGGCCGGMVAVARVKR